MKAPWDLLVLGARWRHRQAAGMRPAARRVPGAAEKKAGSTMATTAWAGDTTIARTDDVASARATPVDVREDRKR